MVGHRFICGIYTTRGKKVQVPFSIQPLDQTDVHDLNTALPRLNIVISWRSSEEATRVFILLRWTSSVNQITICAGLRGGVEKFSTKYYKFDKSVFSNPNLCTITIGVVL